jgi:hypothetical protein
MEFADAEGHQTRSRRRTRRVLRHTASEFLRHAEGHQFEGRLRLSSHLRGSDEPPRTRSRRRTRRVLRHTASEFLRQPEGHQFEGRLRLSSHLRGSDEPPRTRSRRRTHRFFDIQHRNFFDNLRVISSKVGFASLLIFEALMSLPEPEAGEEPTGSSTYSIGISSTC